jgi:hypothetical protein
MELTYNDLMNIYESLNRAIRANEAGKARQKVPSRAGDRKEVELQKLYATREKIATELYNRQKVSA